jgi:hypothetical protein
MLHRLVVVLTASAFIGGMTLQVMPPKAALAADIAPAMGDCAQMAMPPADAAAGHKAPCKGMDPECVKQMGCLGTANLPLHPPSLATVFSYHKVAYWLPAVIFAGRSIKPDLLPPIGL